MAQQDNQRAMEPRASVWDTDDCEPGKAYGYFQGAVREGFLPWTSKQLEDRSFKARFEALQIDQDFIGRINTVPMLAVRTKSDIASSAGEYFYASFNLSGSMSVEQQGKINTTRPGDLVIFDSARPARVTTRPSHERACSSAIALMMPKSRFSFDAEAYFTNRRIARETLLTPLSNTLTLLANRLVIAPGRELSALYEACVDLLPVAAGCFDKGTPAVELGGTNATLQEVLAFIDKSLSDSQLSATNAAEALGLSERYLHKLFARRGSTFGGYVTALRLARIRNELTNGVSRYKPIARIAYKWGFNDLSTFNRAFRKRYGCTPSVIRGITSRETDDAE